MQETSSRTVAMLRDIGMGAMYFFASHMVIRTMFSVGLGRSPEEVGAFLVVVMAAAVLPHVLSTRFLQLRVLASEYVSLPIVSLMATVGAVLELLSILPFGGDVLFLIGGALIGLSCGWLVTIWLSSFQVWSPNPQTFAVSHALLWAVGFYFLFRVAGTVSPGVSEGVLLALPLVAIACMSVEAAHDRGDGEEVAETRWSSIVLVVISAAFAVLTPIVVHVSGKEDVFLDNSLNYMTLFEILVVATILVCCHLLGRLAAQQPLPKGCGVFVTVVLVVPCFLVGILMGVAYVPNNAASLMWETSLWVMLVAVFAYDLRRSLYLVRGLAIGLMFEAMCMGQIAAQVCTHATGSPVVIALAVLLCIAYLAGIARQLLHGPRLGAGAEGPSGAAGSWGGAGSWGDHQDGPARVAATGTPVAADVADEDSPDSLDEHCAQLGKEFFLTQSETAILKMLARGRSARYISEEMGVSFNTVRTHIRHVYEKLGIHSRQELIDLVS